MACAGSLEAQVKSAQNEHVSDCVCDSLVIGMSSPALTAIDHVQLAILPGAEPVCRPYYADLLGMTEVEKPEALRGRGGLWFRAGAVEVHLGAEADFRPALKAHPAFRAAGICGLAERLVAAGHPVRWDEAIARRRRFFSADPCGNRLEFIEA